ncbi:SPOR domain-containing protein [Paenibacillus sp. J5C_2022]|uniref:SPOR domain-containing protein n=1 Tax=Paenibacillus sp. J5C2022 TaxID=2977129 RepID=UPI0021CF198B|nr:SPOR domain-containing protein [Paenibacillus sp. J5C2022]MCU6711087.1 SPOR domain-containing protein [Paenibacillus sp. J5C2022]
MNITTWHGGKVSQDNETRLNSKTRQAGTTEQNGREWTDNERKRDDAIRQHGTAWHNSEERPDNEGWQNGKPRRRDSDEWGDELYAHRSTGASSHTNDLHDEEDKQFESEYRGNFDYLEEDGPHVRRGQGPSWFNVFLSVAGALATGALFGYIILSLFTGSELWPFKERSASSDSAMQQSDETWPGTSEEGTDRLSINKGTTQSGKENIDQEGAVAIDTSAGSSAVAIDGLDFTYYMLQYGVFSNTEGMDAALKQLRDKGLASASIRSGESKYAVFAGVAADAQDLKTLENKLSGLILYGKEVRLQSPDSMNFTGTQEDAKAFFEQTNGLIAVWSNLITAQFEQNSLSRLGDAATDAWEKRHSQWREIAEAMSKGMNDKQGGAYLEKLTAAMEKTASSIAAYNKKPSSAPLWEAQAALMEAVLVQKEWFETMGAL